ncbi:hypothetical protein [Sneathiella limimaris]|uniref:hypothetical protein n=1 Tax=Sneathiella limimaris TaxID=1964213 RepID=UPI00146C5F7F|nr:hypothetical protein [Sneathiella limimaris]
MPSLIKVRMKLRFHTILASFLAFCLISVFPAVSRANVDFCKETSFRPNVSFKHENVQTQLIRSKSPRQITQLSANRLDYQHSDETVLLGLALTEVAHPIRIETRSQQIGNKHCVWLVNVEMTFGQRRSEVYVANKYKAGSCPFRAILRHENQHMDINLKVQTKYAAKIEQALHNMALALKPFYTTSPKKAPQLFGSQIQANLKPYLEAFYEERQRENAKIDTARSYQNVRSQCAKW